MPDELEWQTRKQRIDVRLAGLGWTVHAPGAPTPARGRHVLTEVPTAEGPADYVFTIDGKTLGILEGKRLGVSPQNVLTQAERYARGIGGTAFNFEGLRVPFLYSTNGVNIWFRDVRHALNLSRKLAHFHTGDAMLEMLERDFAAECAWFSTPNTHPKLRDYQILANAKTEAAITNRKRQLLIAMATGTGKTFTMVNQVYRLMKARAARRVLFLVDRRILAAQAVRAFASFEAEPGLKFDQIYPVYSQKLGQDDFDEGEKFDPKQLPRAYLEAPRSTHSFVYVCTIQRMAINLFGRQAVEIGNDDLDEDDQKLDIPIHAFDAIVADECHRGYTSAELSVWRNTLEHFDAIKIGLTATPAAHTTAYFNEVVFRYSYREAVEAGHLVDYDPVKIRSDMRMNGVFLREGEAVTLIDPATGATQTDRLEDERQFDTSEIEKKVTSPASNKLIMQEIKKYADEHEQRYGRFPKMLIFADNDLQHTSHADQLVNICRDVFGRGESFVAKITGSKDVDHPLKRIREFRNRPEPGIVVTVDMLTTGVDIPDLEFIVFLRVVKSRILFEQMIGRGTRKGERFPDKSHFTVFDCFDGTLLEYFKNASAMEPEAPAKASKPIAQVIDEIWRNVDRQYNIRVLMKRLQRIDKEMSGHARELFAAHIPDGDLGAYARALPRNLSDNFTGTMNLLRLPAFLDLLQNYPRPPRTFLVADSATDTITSEALIRDGLGNDYKPSDYIDAFGRFVRDNPAHVAAIQILLDRPADWSTAALTELRTKLAASKERFTLDNLQKAHAIKYHKALADIISMVKHAAREQEPLLTAAERVGRAFDKLTDAQTYSDEQRKWLDRIRAHLIQNLSIDRADFEDVPIFAREGGWPNADRAFDGKLKELLKRLNAEIAA